MTDTEDGRDGREPPDGESDGNGSDAGTGEEGSGSAGGEETSPGGEETSPGGEESTLDGEETTPREGSPGPTVGGRSDASRRTLIRLLVGLGLGLPIAIEGLTLLGLIDSRLLGDEGDGDGAPGTTAAADGVGPGDELLGETPQAETVTDGFVSTAGGRSFTVTVAVENDAEAPYELRLLAVRTYEGEVVEGRATTGRVDPGGSASVVARWDLPEGAAPAAVRVEALTYPEGTGSVQSARWVRLGAYPIR